MHESILISYSSVALHEFSLFPFLFSSLLRSPHPSKMHIWEQAKAMFTHVFYWPALMTTATAKTATARLHNSTRLLGWTRALAFLTIALVLPATQGSSVWWGRVQGVACAWCAACQQSEYHADCVGLSASTALMHIHFAVLHAAEVCRSAWQDLVQRPLSILFFMFFFIGGLGGLPIFGA